MYGEFTLEKVEAWDRTALGLGPWLLWIYVMISNVLLVNLLVAMMSDTYTSVSDNARTEWMFERLGSVLETVERMHVLPPPFSLPVLALSFVRWLLSGLARCLLRGGLGDEAIRGSGSAGGKPAEWSVHGALWEQKIRLQEVTRRAMQRLIREREHESHANAAARDDRWDDTLQALLGSVHELQSDLREMKLDAVQRSESAAAAGGAGGS